MNIHDAIRFNDVLRVHELLEGGANPDEIVDGLCPLHLAVISSNLEILRDLIAHGANLNQQKVKTGETPLFIASKCGRLDIVRELLIHGANVAIQNKDGLKPIDVAGTWKTKKILTQYLEDDIKDPGYE